MGEKLKSLLAGLPVEKMKKGWLPVAGALAATAIIVALLWQNNSHYTMLFGAQQNIPVAQVVEVLGGEQIPYRVEPQSGSLMVRESDLPKARMALAAKGIRAQSPAGYELMDKEEALGISQFLQNVRFKRSLEGELAQSIMALNAVEFARVHLGISETSSFVLSNKPDSSASVVLRLRYGQELADEQVSAIVHLVAGSMPGLKPQQVRVVDQNGTLLSSDQYDLSRRQGGKAGSEAIQRMRQDTERSLANVLMPVIGSENFRVSVVPQLNFSQIEETQERFIGQPRPASESMTQENTTELLAIGIPGSLSNRPVNPPASKEEDESAKPQATRNQAQRKFHYDRDVRHIRHPGFQLEKMSVAVVLNQNSPVVKAWTAKQREQVEVMLVQAAGIDAERGDILTMTMLSFSEVEPHVEPDVPWWERQTVIDWSKRGGIALLVTVITLFGLLPMLRRIGRRTEKPATAKMQASVPAPSGSDEDGESDGQATSLPVGSFQGEENLPPSSSGLETKIAFLQTLAQSETDRVAEVIKQWISSNERSSSRK
ncbi:flagellar basal-body MS-ring/collar protein FliF [Erwinia sorbitola]|uniref:Flagellar M-ring protein n=1 Tax=Erwinia sorbitola TaxID=2681984 RepID=A0A6I6EF67_9GAMM|nr:flagellar basal-body MS-ring/collar protein FliF [Erwinia sorbitola]QGU88534.1 flagellar M-ring protein FliF [Erwinia sorbitola]